MMLVWLIGGFLLFMGLMSLLSISGAARPAGLGLSFMFCLVPGAVLFFSAWPRIVRASAADRVRPRALRLTRCSRRPPNRSRRRWAFLQDGQPDSHQSPHPGGKLHLWGPVKTTWSTSP